MVIVVYNHLISSVGRVGRRLMTAAAATERDSQPGTRRKQKRARWAGNNDAQLGKGGRLGSISLLGLLWVLWELDEFIRDKPGEERGQRGVEKIIHPGEEKRLGNKKVWMKVF